MSDKDSKGELKPCPCCGKKPRLFEIFSNSSMTKSSGWCVECKCGVSITGRMVGNDWSRAETLKAWNTRTTSKEDLKGLNQLADKWSEIHMDTVGATGQSGYAYCCNDLREYLAI